MVQVSGGQEWQFHISTELILADQLADIYYHFTVRASIGRSTGRYILPFLLLELILADQVADLPPSGGI